MKNKNLHILIVMVSAVFFQACGELPVQSGFTEETIDTSNTSLTPGIQEGICEETDQEFNFISTSDPKDAGKGVTFIGGTGIWVGPNGETYEKAPQTKRADVPSHEPYECIMEVSQDGEEITFSPKSKDGAQLTQSFIKGGG